MEKKDGTRTGNLSGKGLNRINRNLLVFAFFLLLSFIFWYLNSISKELETDIRYPVIYTNVPDEKTLAEEAPSRLTLILKGHGYSMLRLRILGKGNPIVIDFSEISLNSIQNNRSGDHYIITAPLIANFNSQLLSECKIMSVKPDTLFFSFK